MKVIEKETKVVISTYKCETCGYESNSPLNVEKCEEKHKLANELPIPRSIGGHEFLYFKTEKEAKSYLESYCKANDYVLDLILWVDEGWYRLEVDSDSYEQSCYAGLEPAEDQLKYWNSVVIDTKENIKQLKELLKK